MYRKKTDQLEFVDFALPFSGKLSEKNRWVKLKKLIPWEEFEEKYSEYFSQNNMGAPAKSFQMALGALIIKERLNLTDEETVEQIRENPYLQYFIGLPEYQDEAPFDPSMMVHFRKRINIEMISSLNDRLIEKAEERKSDDDDQYPGKGSSCSDKNTKNDKSDDENTNKGKLIIDATCTPADIKYPTDLNLLNEAREKAEEIIDTLHPFIGWKKPRTYRNVARRDFLRTAKKRQPTRKAIRKAVKKQLQYLKRDLSHIDRMVKEGALLSSLSRRQYRNLLVIHEVYRQQKEMHDENKNSVDNRIVSISQPHVRPIVRGKTAKKTEFGAKITVSIVNGYSRIEHLDWENYNESTVLQESIEKYKERYGYYPASVEADKIFRTRDNHLFCKGTGVKITGPPLGRRKAGEKVEQENVSERNAIEGKFGEGKRKYGLERIMAKLDVTSESVIAMIILVMNMEKALRIIWLNFINRILRASASIFGQIFAVTA